MDRLVSHTTHLEAEVKQKRLQIDNLESVMNKMRNDRKVGPGGSPGGFGGAALVP